MPEQAFDRDAELELADADHSAQLHHGPAAVDAAEQERFDRAQVGDALHRAGDELGDLGILDAATSPVTFEELDRTPEPLKADLLDLLGSVRRLTADKDEVERLALAYLRDRVIPEQYTEDAEHAAYATVCKADVLVSLNLRHLANEWAERRVCAVNLREGYQAISIRTPEEVLEYED